VQFSGDAIKCLQWLLKCRQRRTGCIVFSMGLNESQNIQFGSPVLLISLTEVVGHVSPARLRQLVKLDLFLPKTLHVMLYCFRDCAHHPAGFVIFAKLAQLRVMFIIILVFPSYGVLIPIINTIFIESSTAAYLSISFFPRLILWLNLLLLCCKSYQSVMWPQAVSSIDVIYTSPSSNHSLEYSSNGSAPGFKYLSTR